MEHFFESRKAASLAAIGKRQKPEAPGHVREPLIRTQQQQNIAGLERQFTDVFPESLALPRVP